MVKLLELCTTCRGIKTTQHYQTSCPVYVNSLLLKLKQYAHEVLTMHYDGDITVAGFDLPCMESTTINKIENACVAPLFELDNYLDY